MSDSLEGFFSLFSPHSNVLGHVNYILIKRLYPCSHAHADTQAAVNLVLITCTLVELWRFL